MDGHVALGPHPSAHGSSGLLLLSGVVELVVGIPKLATYLIEARPFLRGCRPKLLPQRVGRSRIVVIADKDVFRCPPQEMFQRPFRTHNRQIQEACVEDNLSNGLAEPDGRAEEKGENRCCEQAVWR